MVNRVYAGWGIVGIILVMLAVTTILVFKPKDTVAGEEDWTNITEISEEFLDKYFDDYEAMREETDPENILMVTSKARPETYGAVSVVEAPNYLYMLSYTDTAARDVAFENLTADGVTVEKNQMYNLMGDTSETYFYPDDDYWSWGVKEMKLNNLINKLNAKKDLSTVVVAVIDTGMDVEYFYDNFSDTRTLLTHCMVASWCPDGMVDVPELEHGTHVGGTVTEATSDNVRTMAIKVTNDSEGRMNNVDIIAGINYAVAQGVDVINMSLGGPDDDPAMEIALSAAEDVGVINVAAAGNDYKNELNYPASYENTLSVAALQKTRINGELELDRWICNDLTGAIVPDCGSNYGEKIDFAAPGFAVFGINGELEQGTSMATPHIAAVMANFKGLNKNLTRAQAKELLKTLTKDLGDEGWDQYYGWGMPEFPTTDKIKFCAEHNCDEYGIFASHWKDPVSSGVSTLNYDIEGDNLTLISEKPLATIIEKDGVYTRVAASATEDNNKKTFDLSEVDFNSNLYVELVGDVDLNGTVNVLDLAGVKRSILLPTSGNYQALSDKVKVLADITGDGGVNVLDLARIKRSILLTTSANYLPLSW
ncbi:S8 family serine peptidase [Candidatus Saccharibacteria bacterium]|nr:S8 family serine peptidase [Candidatus Saccharibacteria bacterium]